jgi:nitroimidazol reductase NimA-like FMN-containing flavoprotein (pyridoxamine 5'-phosphate oxidase superfamily)
VCFEVDGIDEVQRSGWSVLVKGRARELVDAAELRAASRTPLEPWGHGPKSCWIRLVPAEVTGRRIHAPTSRMGPSTLPDGAQDPAGDPAGLGTLDA